MYLEKIIESTGTSGDAMKTVRSGPSRSSRASPGAMDTSRNLRTTRLSAKGKGRRDQGYYRRWERPDSLALPHLNISTVSLYIAHKVLLHGFLELPFEWLPE